MDALLATSRALVGVAARSLGAWEGQVTLTQYRLLVVLCARGALRVADVAEALAVTPPNGTRICDRLVQKGLVRRTEPDAGLTADEPDAPQDEKELRARLAEKRMKAAHRGTAPTGGLTQAARAELADRPRHGEQGMGIGAQGGRAG